jgi:hypothetical protein
MTPEKGIKGYHGDSADRQSVGKMSDIVLKGTGMTVGYVAGTQREKPFGFDLYNAPKADHKYEMRTMTNWREARRSQAHDYGRARSWMPAPSKHSNQPDWRKNIPLKTGCFLKKQRETFTAEVLRVEKPKPGPNKYTNFKQMEGIEGGSKIMGVYHS